MKFMTAAMIFAAASGYLILIMAGRELGAAQFDDFATLWAAFFAAVGVANALMQELTRSVRAATPPATDSSAAGPASVPPIVVMSLILASILGVAVLASWPLWEPLGLNPRGGFSVVVLAIGIAGATIQAGLAGALSGTERWSRYALLMSTDAALRLAVAVVAFQVGRAEIGIVIATVAGSVSWIFLLADSEARMAIRHRLDTTIGIVWRNTADAMAASAGTAVLVVGFPVLISASARADDPASLVGAVIAAVTLTRAPLLVPLTGFQSALIVHFVRNRHRLLGAILTPFAALAALGSAGAVGAWLVGPFLLELMFADAGFVLPGTVLAGLTLAAVGTATLMLTGNAALVAGRHRLYSCGWWLAVAASTAILLLAPAPLDTRATIALLVGPALGVLLHLVGIGQAQRQYRNEDAGNSTQRFVQAGAHDVTSEDIAR